MGVVILLQGLARVEHFSKHAEQKFETIIQVKIRVFVNRKHPKILPGNSNISNIEAGEIQSHQTVKP